MAKSAVASLLMAACGGQAQDLFLPSRKLAEAQGAVAADVDLICPSGFEQVGNINTDIQGCGLEDCSARYHVPTLHACSLKCAWSGLGCKAFTWAPLGGDSYHKDHTVCTMYGSAEPDQVWGPNQILCKKTEGMPECPLGWVQAGELNDVQGCGLEGCDSRYSLRSSKECSQSCDALSACKAFTWAPVGGDGDHPSVAVCSLYGVSEPNQAWGSKQIMCKREGLAIPELQCPRGWVQVGGLNSDIQGCGLEGCDGGFTVPTREACSLKCLWSGLGCVAFSWAPVGGDRDHLAQAVCRMYGTDVPNQVWGPNQILCKKA